MTDLGRRSLLMIAAGLAVSPFAACASQAAGGPVDVLIIRHGEEPDKGESLDLDERGRQRAAALPTLFSSRFPKPQFLFAAKPTKHTNRSVETLEPLAAALKVPIDDAFSDEDYEGLARTLLSHRTYDGAHVLICWQHQSIPQLAHALGVPSPPKWSSKTYDRIWRVRFSGGAPALDDLPQALLPGDGR